MPTRLVVVTVKAVTHETSGQAILMGRPDGRQDGQRFSASDPTAVSTSGRPTRQNIHETKCHGNKHLWYIKIC